MWYLQSANETFSALCSSPFWDSNATWNSPTPDLTSCFEKTALVWLPCAFLWLVAPLEIVFLRRAKAFSIPFNAYNISKLATIAVLALTAVVDIAGYILTYDKHHPSVDIYSPAIKFASFCLLFALTLANIRCGVRSSGLLFTAALLLVFCGAPQLRTEFNSRHDADRGMTGVLSYVLYYLGVLVVFFLNCFADSSPARVGVPTKMKSNPLDESSFLSKIFFGWVDELTWRGYRRGLTDNDVWNVDDEMRTAGIAKKFESRWQRARQRLRKLKAPGGYAFESEKLLKNGKIPGSTMSYWTNGSEKVSILRPLVEAFGVYSLVGIGFRFLDSAMGLANAQTLNLILASVDGAEKNEYMWQGCFYIFRLIVICVLEMLFLSYSCYVLGRVGIQIRTALMSLVYKKAMKISSGARKDYAVGEIVNLMAVDAQRFVQLLTFYIPFFLTGSVEICIAMYCLWNILGICVVAGIAVFLLLMTVNALITPRIQRLQIRQMKLKDKRVKLTNEILSGIKVIKLYACEPSFEKQISRIREKEVQLLRRIGYLQTWFSFSGMSIPFLISLVVFGTYVLMSEEHALSPQITFVSLSLFNIIKFPIYLLPGVVSGIVQCFVAIKRLDNFLNSEELDPDAVQHEQRAEPVIIENGEFSWDSYDGFPILCDINVKVKSGSLVAVVGSVGSGKSSLLSAILGEMYKKSGIVNTTNRLAYVSQQAWIRNATLEDNITFGRVKQAVFYDSVLEACAMLPDLKILPAGDQTELGEKGVNMSGGQKQRISLARAVYSDADTYLLDDPLSAVDSHVGKHIFEKVIGPNGLLKKKTRILVTHNVAYLPQMDHIIVLQNGTISECGTYDELLKSGREFADFLATYVKDNDEDHDSKAHDQDSHQADGFASPEVVKKKDEVKPHTLIEEEAIQAGNVKWKVFAYYLRAAGPLIVMVIIAANVLSQVFAVASYYWLSVWSSDAENSKLRDKQLTYVGTYAMWGVGQAISITTMAVALYIGTLKAAKYIHNDLLNSVLHWPVVIFDRIPSGRILNRFSSDVDVLDNVLPHEVLELSKDTATIIATLFIFVYNTPKVLCVLLPVAAAYCVFQRFYVATSKQLKRFEAVSKSPIYSHFSDTITGAQSLRAYGLQKKFIDAAEKKIDAHLRNSYAIFILERWLVSRLSLLGLIIILGAATFAILSRNVLGPALLGLSITYTLQVNIYFAWWIRHVCEVETNAVAVERIKEYTTEVEREAAWTLPNDDKTVTKNWPKEGQVVFENFQVRYHDDLEPVLKGISFTVDGGKKVGIVGRTGAGKSSLTLSLFRLIESSAGSILVDDVDISSIGLHTLRNRLTIIPQDPVLFSGTLRMNLDPAEKYSDESIWRALEVAHLKTYVSSLNAGLQYKIEESGTNFSLGQRQLICLARALLRKTKLLILDEATAAIDYETDDLIQAAIREEFPDCTVLTIAHRLNTVLDYDKILVLDKGRIVELDSPDALLQSKESSFYRMAVDAGLV